MKKEIKYTVYQAISVNIISYLHQNTEEKPYIYLKKYMEKRSC
ncbi:hypothetical protein EUCA11A_34340 [Eubacterium callanderi]|nr:hypothetical protein EUCA2A_34340 [Eubacterium callanderi]WPK73544.1 hypothetical protein EUCA11A_34340 [Eubacterium callanderi]